MPHPPSDGQPSELRQAFTLKCDKCGERMAVQVDDGQSALAVECSTCGAVANAAIHWTLRRSDPILIFDATRGA
jgi:uncharacterized Zn finger protein